MWEVQLIDPCFAPLQLLLRKKAAEELKKEQERKAAERRDQFYTTPFRPETFRINFHNEILDKFPHHNSQYKNFRISMDNNSRF
jgi:hypothetical protein